MSEEWTTSRMPAGRPSEADLVGGLSRFDGPPEEFLANLLAVQGSLAGASSGAVFRPSGQGRLEVLAFFPGVAAGEPAPQWLDQIVREAAQAMPVERTIIKPLASSGDLYGQPPQRSFIILPLRSQAFSGLAAFLVESGNPAVLEASRQRLELTVSLLSLYEMRLVLQRRSAEAKMLQQAVGALVGMAGQDKFAGATMALCNEIASRWNCQRVSLGFIKGRYVRLKAISNAEKFVAKTTLAAHIEAAMEECSDQDIEVVHPSGPQDVCVSRAAGELSLKHGPMWIVSLPLRKAGQVIAVLACERLPSEPMNAQDVEGLRLACDLTTPGLALLHKHDRWLGARMAADARSVLAGVIGPKHTWLKLLAAAILALVLWMIFAKGDHRIGTDFTAQSAEKWTVPVPFDGYVARFGVKIGDTVRSGQELAQIDTSDLRLELASAVSQMRQYDTQADVARSEGKTSDAKIAQAQAQAASAKIDLLKRQLELASLKAPAGGTIVKIKDDLDRHISPPVKTGDGLFEIAPMGGLWAELAVPDDGIAWVRPGQQGDLAVAARPDKKISFVVERITPVAEVRKGKNVFMVRVRLAESPDWLRPGMEGPANVIVGRRSYGWLWTHDLIDWIRLHLWI
ncbi:MAG: HlyD family efflux transporter periplasmic adaptor subunit [Planctomycetes bacterium]|nr:HlyD family efflux transporter periplasmic adaptor subunit [Planctomycetota bacterium]